MLAGIIGVLASRNRPTGNVGNDWLFRAPDSIYDDTGKGFPVTMADDSPPFGAIYQDTPPFNYPVTMADDGRYFGALYGMVPTAFPVVVEDSGINFSAIVAPSPSSFAFGVAFTEPPGTYADSEIYLDAGNAVSYSTGQGWANLVVAPTSGATQTAYDYALGSDFVGVGHDPDFVGSPGNPSSYFSFNGLQYFTIKDAGGAPAFLREMHYPNRRFTIVAWMYYTATAPNVAPIFDSGTTDQGGSDMSRGLIYADLGELATGTSAPDSKHRFRIKNSSGGTSATEIVSDAFLERNRINMIAISCASDVANGSFLYKNGAYDQVGGLDFFTVTTQVALDIAGTSRIGARGDGNFRVANGTRIYMMRFFNDALSKSELDTIFEQTRGRFGI